MYILSTEVAYYRDGWLPYVVDIPLNAAQLLTDEKFLCDYDYKLGQGGADTSKIKGYTFRLHNEDKDIWEMVVVCEDWDGEEVEESFYLIPIAHVSTFGVKYPELGE